MQGVYISIITAVFKCHHRKALKAGNKRSGYYHEK